MIVGLPGSPVVDAAEVELGGLEGGRPVAIVVDAVGRVARRLEEESDGALHLRALEGGVVGPAVSVGQERSIQEQVEERLVIARVGIAAHQVRQPQRHADLVEVLRPVVLDLVQDEHDVVDEHLAPGQNACIG